MLMSVKTRRGRLGIIVAETPIRVVTPVRVTAPAPAKTTTTTTRTVTTSTPVRVTVPPQFQFPTSGNLRYCMGPGCENNTSTPVTTPATNPASSISATSLASILQIYNTNPAALTAAQWATLQQAGIIPSTLPYSSAGLLAPGGGSGGYTASPLSMAGDDPQCLALGMTGGPYPNCTPPAGTTTGASSITDFLQTSYGPLTGLEWLLVGGGAYLLFFRKKGR